MAISRSSLKRASDHLSSSGSKSKLYHVGRRKNYIKISITCLSLRLALIRQLFSLWVITTSVATLQPWISNGASLLCLINLLLQCSQRRSLKTSPRDKNLYWYLSPAAETRVASIFRWLQRIASKRIWQWVWIKAWPCRKRWVRWSQRVARNWTYLLWTETALTCNLSASPSKNWRGRVKSLYRRFRVRKLSSQQSRKF